MKRRHDPADLAGLGASDGRKGIRDAILVVYLVECAHHVARRIVEKMDDPRVQLIGFPVVTPMTMRSR